MTQDFTGQLLLAIGSLTGAIVFLFGLLSKQWQARLTDLTTRLDRCEAAGRAAVVQTGQVADIAARGQVVTAEAIKRSTDG